MIKHLLASTALAAALSATTALATHGVEGDPNVPGKSEHAPGQLKGDGEPARGFAPGQLKGDGESARGFAPGQHDAGEDGVNGDGVNGTNG